MTRSFLTPSALSTAVGLALANAPAGRAAEGMKEPPQMVKDNMARAQKDNLQKCSASTPYPRTIARKGRIRVQANLRRRAIRSRSCCSPPATAARFKAASSTQAEA